MGLKDIDEATRRDLDAAAFRRLLEHLRARSDAQNIDLMNLAGFCRNCLANWWMEAAQARGLAVTKDDSREEIYAMPYEDWRALNQRPASEAQKAAYEVNRPKGH